MLRRLRRRLALIRYYSANRARSRWRTARAWSFLVAMVLAVPMVFFMEPLTTRLRDVASIDGALLTPLDGEPVFALVTPTSGPRTVGPVVLEDARLTGEWFLAQPRDVAGWPYETAVRRRPVRLDLRDYYEMTEDEIDYQAVPGDPLRTAIEEALAAADRADWVVRWNAPARGAATHRRWSTVIGAALTWWVGLTVAAFIALGVLQLATSGVTRLGGRGARARADDGHCPTCGYDLRGLEYSDRCPECGTLAE